MNILAISPEAGITTSSLSTAVDRMTEAFAHAGTTVVTCSPLYKTKIANFETYECVYKGEDRLHHKPFSVYKSSDSLHTYIYNEELFGRPYVYGEPGYPYADNHIRFSFLASAALEYAAAQGFAADAVLGHEWGGALAGNLLRTLYADDFKDVPFFLTVHNITYDFLVPESEIEHLGLPLEDYNMDGYEFWGKVSLLKAGILYAAKVLLPSSGYRDTILSTNLSGGLTGFLRRNAGKIKGIQFGVSYNTWDFNREAKLPIEEAKAKAKAELATLVGADFGDKLLIYAHLDAEAGNTSETLSTLLADLAKLNTFVLVGVQENQPERDYFNSVAAEYPNNFCVRSIDETTGNLQKYLAGADILFAGNLREPSTSIILKAMAAGTIPVTGRDTGVANMLVPYVDCTTEGATALLVDDPNSPVQMLRSIKKCQEIFHSECWEKLVNNTYGFRYEWDRTISQYLITLGEH